MAQYIVQSGDTLWDIAERCYGDGRLWQSLADHNALARAGVLYEGQRLEAPLSPKPPWLADAHRAAQTLGHTPVKIQLHGSGPLFRYDGIGVLALNGMVGELIFHRHGSVSLGELSFGALLGYRLEQIAWAKRLFVDHICSAYMLVGYHFPSSTGPHVPLEPYRLHGPDYTITGRIGVWWSTIVHSGMEDRAYGVRTNLTGNLFNLFDLATLVLGELPAAAERRSEDVVPLGRVLLAACPHLISPGELWALTRDERCFLSSADLPILPQEADGTPPTESLTARQPRKPARKAPGKRFTPKNKPTGRNRVRRKPRRAALRKSRAGRGRLLSPSQFEIARRLRRCRR